MIDTTAIDFVCCPGQPVAFVKMIMQFPSYPVFSSLFDSGLSISSAYTAPAHAFLPHRHTQSLRRAYVIGIGTTHTLTHSTLVLDASTCISQQTESIASGEKTTLTTAPLMPDVIWSIASSHLAAKQMRTAHKEGATECSFSLSRKHSSRQI